MLRGLETVVSNAVLIVVAAGLAYISIALVRVWRFLGQATKSSAALPPITVFKPICGIETELLENLCSFCTQDYPQYQVIFCFASARDRAIPVARRVMELHPGIDIALVIGEPLSAANPKIANLIGGLPLAKHELFVIADADVRVSTGYLRAIAAAFEDERVGAATCLYGGAPRGGFASVLGAMHLNDHFAPSVLVAAAIEPLRFCLGATMAVRRKVLEAIGGLAALAEHLGDDYVLGALVARQGYEVILSTHVVRSLVVEPGIAGLFVHQLRWARTIRKQRPLGYAFLFAAYPLPFAACYLALAHGSLLAIALFVIIVGLRYALHVAASDAFARGESSPMWMIPLSDAFDLAVWLVGCFGNAVDWRNRRFELLTDGRVDSHALLTGRYANDA